ncbi:hypothetical protein [uncultured Microscilla sp.]|uniref:hypothetical protein n=1 Tax=uncultured Microscilla sp. TaxID=432653 RepID=UPI0026236CDB|nr:hypothetical protein [uncultured Microscilla sp.]
MSNSNQVLYKEKNATIEYSASNQCLTINIHGFLTSPQLIKLFENGYKLYTTAVQPNTGVVLNTEKLGAVKKAEQDWLRDTWNLQMYKAGMKKLAIINADNIFGEVAINTLKENVNQAVRYAIAAKSFKDMKAAHHWLVN